MHDAVTEMAVGSHIAEPGVYVRQLNLPLLTNRQWNPGISVTLSAGIAKTNITLDFAGTSVSPRAVQLARLPVTSTWQKWEQAIPVGDPYVLSEQRLTVELPSCEEDTVFWFLVDVSSVSDLNGRVCLRVSDIRTVDGDCPKLQCDCPALSLRLGYRVRHAGDDGVAGYRIPGLVTTPAGTLLAVYDIRRESNRDLQGDIDIGLSRSIDGGITWEAMRVVLDMGTWGGLPEKFNGASDPCILVDRITGEIFVFACWMHGLRTKDGIFREDLTENSADWAHQWHPGYMGSGPGMEPRETAQFLMTRSSDDGKTWSKPVSLTGALKKPEWFLFCPAPGNGITTSDGVLVVPSQGRAGAESRFSTIIISRDHGATWERAEIARMGTNECAVAELPDKSLMLNMRDPDNRSRPPGERARAVSVTADQGRTWDRHPSDHDPVLLREPVCMGSLLQVPAATHVRSVPVLLFCNPDDGEKRAHITIKASLDNGLTWPKETQFELDELQGAGYSCMSPVGTDEIGVLYESSQGSLVFQRVLISELLCRPENTP